MLTILLDKMWRKRVGLPSQKNDINNCPRYWFFCFENLREKWMVIFDRSFSMEFEGYLLFIKISLLGGKCSWVNDRSFSTDFFIYPIGHSRWNFGNYLAFKYILAKQFSGTNEDSLWAILHLSISHQNIFGTKLK